MWQVPPRPIYQKSGKSRGGAADSFYREWAINHPYCMACGDGEPPWPGLSTHHLVKSGRSHEAANLLRLCGVCHDLAEGGRVREGGELLPQLTLAVCLTLKMVRDGEAWDAKRLRQLRGMNLPVPAEVPAAVERMYRGNRPFDRGRFYEKDALEAASLSVTDANR
jgi:hypothetical protein